MGGDTMGGSTRRFRLALTSLVVVVGLGQARPVSGADDKPIPQAPTEVKAKGQGGGPAAGPAAKGSDWRSEVASFFSQPGDDPPRASVPLRPATVDDRRRL